MIETIPKPLDEAQFIATAAELAGSLSLGDIILLDGDLGAGKTVFARAVIRTLMGDNDLSVPSPTFPLVQGYETPKGMVYHYDLYRLDENESDILELGWEEQSLEGICLVEWPQRLGILTPKKHIAISLTIPENHPDKRFIQIDDRR